MTIALPEQAKQEGWPLTGISVPGGLDVTFLMTQQDALCLLESFSWSVSSVEFPLLCNIDFLP